MAHKRYGSKPKPHPRASALEGVRCSDPNHEVIAKKLVVELEPHLRKRNPMGRARALETVRKVFDDSDLVHIDGEVYYRDRDSLAELSLKALADSGQLTHRALTLLTQDVESDKARKSGSSDL